MAKLSNIKKFIVRCTPPIIIEVLQKTPQSILFDGESALFKQHIKDIKHYGEYGLGLSTIWVYENTSATIYAVDSSKYWVDKITHQIEDTKERCFIDYENIGPVADMGYSVPEDYSHRKSFFNYINNLWTRKHKPDLVLIDGRFRVACFLQTLLQAAPNTKIIFDDYVERKRYHIVEEFIKPTQCNKRQALFIVPPHLPKDEIEKERKRFEYVYE